MESDHVHKKPSATRLTCGCFLALLMLIVLLPGIAFLVWNERNAQEIERRLAAIRTQRLPTTFAELDEFSTLPRGATDTTQLWLDGVKPLLDPASAQAAKALPFLGDGKIPALGESWDEIDASEAFLVLHAASLEKFRTAARLGGAARFPIDYQAGVGANLSPVQNQRAAARILKLEALVHAHRGNARQCAESIQSQFAVEHSLHHAPYLVSYLVQLAFRGMVIDTMSNTIGGVPFTDEELRSFQTEIRSWNNSESLLRAIATERVLGCQMFREAGLPVTAKSPKRIPFSRSDFAFYLETYDDLESAARLEFPQALSQMKVAHAQVQINSGGRFGGVMRNLTPMLMSAVDAAFRATARELSAERAIDAAIAVVMFHRKTGKLPESLAQLTPEFIAEVPNDAFNGQTLRYRRVENGFVVYSVGQDLTDDGGNPDQKIPSDDVVFVRMLPLAPVNGQTNPALESTR